MFPRSRLPGIQEPKEDGKQRQIRGRLESNRSSLRIGKRWLIQWAQGGMRKPSASRVKGRKIKPMTQGRGHLLSPAKAFSKSVSAFS